MKYYFEIEKSNEGITTLIVYMANDYSLFGVSPRIVNVFTGVEAENIYKKLTEKEEQNNGQASNS